MNSSLKLIILTFLFIVPNIASAYNRDLGRDRMNPVYDDRGEYRYKNIYGTRTPTYQSNYPYNGYHRYNSYDNDY